MQPHIVISYLEIIIILASCSVKCLDYTSKSQVYYYWYNKIWLNIRFTRIDCYVTIINPGTNYNARDTPTALHQNLSWLMNINVIYGMCDKVVQACNFHTVFVLSCLSIVTKCNLHLMSNFNNRYPNDIKNISGLDSVSLPATENKNILVWFPSSTSNLP